MQCYLLGAYNPVDNIVDATSCFTGKLSSFLSSYLPFIEAFPAQKNRNVCFWIPPPFGQSYSEKGKQRHIPYIIVQELRWIETTQPADAGTSRFSCLPRQTSLFTRPSLFHPVVGIPFIGDSSFYTVSTKSEYSIYPMDFTRCEGLSPGFKARLVTVDLHCKIPNRLR